MLKQCQDSYHSTFGTYEDMLDYHEDQAKNSLWHRCQVNTLQVEPLDKTSPLYGSLSDFASGVTQEAVDDTAENLGLAIRVNGDLYPVRETAYKSLLDRAKIGGTALPKLGRDVLANVLNACLQLFPAEALLLIRDEKVSAVHSGDSVDYSILPINELLATLKDKLDDRFPGAEFEAGYCDHSLVSASWSMPNQREELLGTYVKTLTATGKGAYASKLTPGIRFMTSDTGVASAKVSALLVGGQHPIHIGKCVAVDHRHQSKISDFTDVLDQLFAQFGDVIAKLEALLDITLDYPVNAMTRVCKKLSLPKKAAVEALAKQLRSEGHYLAGVPGFYRDTSGLWCFIHEKRGILIPVRDHLGRIQGLQVRRDNVTKRKFRWISSTDQEDGCRAEGWTHLVGSVRPTLVLTEGPMKADVINALTGMTVLAVPGVNTLAQLELTLTELRREGLVEIKTAFDMDFAINHHVQNGYNSLLELLGNMGFRYGTYLWDPNYKGLDDYIWECCFQRRRSQ